MTTKLTIYQSNNQVLVLPKVTDEINNVLLSGVTITATLYTKPAGVAVEGFIDLPFVESETTLGDYVCEIPSTVNPPVGSYYIIYSGNKDGVKFSIRQEADVKVRKL